MTTGKPSPREARILLLANRALAVLTLPIVVILGMIIIPLFIEIMETMFSGAGALSTILSFLLTLVAIGMFVGFIWFLIKWVEEGAWGFFTKER